MMLLTVRKRLIVVLLSFVALVALTVPQSAFADFFTICEYGMEWKSTLGEALESAYQQNKLVLYFYGNLDVKKPCPSCTDMKQLIDSAVSVLCAKEKKFVDLKYVLDNYVGVFVQSGKDNWKGCMPPGKFKFPAISVLNPRAWCWDSYPLFYYSDCTGYQDGKYFYWSDEQAIDQLIDFLKPFVEMWWLRLTFDKCGYYYLL